MSQWESTKNIHKARQAILRVVAGDRPSGTPPPEVIFTRLDGYFVG